MGFALFVCVVIIFQMIYKSAESATDYRQAVKRSETPAKTAHKHISAEGTTDFLSPTSGFIFTLFN